MNKLSVKSRFSFFYLLVIGFSFFVVLGLVALQVTLAISESYKMINFFPKMGDAGAIATLLVLLLSLSVLFLHELRKKLIRLELLDDRIEVKRLLSSAKTIRYEDVVVFHRDFEHMRFAIFSGEYIEIADPYFKVRIVKACFTNFDEIKSLLKEKISHSVEF